MGIGVSNPVDASTKTEIEELIKAILKTFTTQYVKWYAICLVQKLKEDAKAKKSPYKLLERPENTDLIRTGWLMKEGGVRKTWKKRFFVARHDYVVDYYEKEEESKKEKGKVKGTMSLCGYHVVEDPNDGIIKRLKNLAEKMGVNLDDIPKPKEYPKLTFEVNHHRRRCYFIQCENENQFKEWVETFKTVCRNAYGFRNKEVVHQAAFQEAVRRTRWELGRWGWWSYGGSEEQILADLISDQLEWAIMGRIYGKITGPWAIRNTVRNQIMKTLDTLIMAGVGPAWKAMSSAVESLRPQIEPKIKELVDPIGKAEGELVEKIKDAAMSVINPLLEQHVTPHLAKIMAIIQSPMTEGYEESYRLYEEQIGKYELPKDIKKEELLKSFKNLDYFPRSWDMYAASRKIDVLYDPLWLLREIFSDIYPWSLIWRGHDEIRTTMDNAMYTFESKLLKAAEANETPDKEQFKAKVLKHYKHDGRIRTIEWYCGVMKTIVMPPFNAVVIPACKTIISPIADAIPEPLKQFIDIEKLFDDIVDSIIDASIETVVTSGQDYKKEVDSSDDEKETKKIESKSESKSEEPTMESVAEPNMEPSSGKTPDSGKDEVVEVTN